MNNSYFKKNDVIHIYSREQAIKDGILVDVSKTAKEAGINIPVALTSSVWDLYIVPPEKLENSGQSVEGRLWDLLWMFKLKAVRCNSTLVYFSCLFLGENERLEEAAFKALLSPGDRHEPVVTIMLPGED